MKAGDEGQYKNRKRRGWGWGSYGGNLMIWHDMAIYGYTIMGERRKSESRQSKSEGIKISHKE